MLAQPPDVGLVACQTGTVDTALLTSTDANGLSVLNVADTVRLGVLQRDEGDNQVALSLRRESLVLRGDILEEGRVVKFDFVAALFEGHTKALLTLDGLWLVGRVNLDDVIGTLTLVLQYLDSFSSEVGGNDTVADLTLQQQGGGSVASVAKSYKVTIR